MLVCLDTNILIYLIEDNPIWTPKAIFRIDALLAADDQIAICDAARLECLLRPLARGNTADTASYRTFFGNPIVKMLPITPQTWEHAAQLGASCSLKAMDSIHLATAIEHGCAIFLTADSRLTRCTEITVEVLT